MAETAGQYAATGRVRRVVSGTGGNLGLVDGDGGSSPAHLWAGDMEHTYPPELMSSGACITALQGKVAALEQLAAVHSKAIEDVRAALAVALGEAAALRDRVVAVELGRCACKGAGQ